MLKETCSVSYLVTSLPVTSLSMMSFPAAVCLVPVEPEAELQGHSLPPEGQPRVSAPYRLLHIQTGM